VSKAKNKGPFYCMPAELPNPHATKTWHRYRIIIPAFSEEQCARIAEKVSEFCGYQVERIIAVTNGDGTENLGEVTIERKDFALGEVMGTHQQAMLNALGIFQ
jgi:hypothetical protein